MSEIFVNPIATIRTPFKQKFAIPRQPNLVNALGHIVMEPTYSDAECFKGLENFSHLWLLFHFSATSNEGWKPAVKAPRLGGNVTLGVFASRSPFRPNSIGLSVVKNDGTKVIEGQQCLQVIGVDLLDNTPILDIKPYLPYADNVQNSTASLLNNQPLEEPETLHVEFSASALQQLELIEHTYSGFKALVSGVLAQDPRPAYKRKLKHDHKTYAVKLYDIDVKWRVNNKQILVEQFTTLESL